MPTKARQRRATAVVALTLAGCALSGVPAVAARLITCGGDHDRRTGYAGNVVVFAHLVETREPPATTARR